MERSGTLQTPTCSDCGFEASHNTVYCKETVETVFLWKQLLNIARDGVRITTTGVQNFATTH